MHWPFQTQSVATDTLSIFTGNAPALFRRATWNPPKPDDVESTVTSPRDSTLIPDYVVNFIRGETPETVARRKQNGGARGMRAVDITHQHRPKRSHMALLESANGSGFLRQHDDGYAHSHTTGTSTTTDMRQILPSDEKSRNGWRGLTSGWRSGVMLNLVLIVIILIAGFICLVVAETRTAFTLGYMDIFAGSCSTARSINWGLHAAINVAVVTLIVGANYVFQVLSSPKRSEIAGAHETKKWLEIGVPSVRNFTHIGRGRAVLAVVLLAAAVATQIMCVFSHTLVLLWSFTKLLRRYNSIIFISETGFDYNLIAVESSFITGSDFSNSTDDNSANLTRNELLDLQELAGQNELTNLSTTACIDVFGAVFNNEYQNILLVVFDESSSSNSLILTGRAGLNTSATSELSSRTTTTSSQIRVDGAPVASCLAQPALSTHDSCTINLNATLFIIVLALNVFSLVATACVLLLRRFAPLVTLGDAISSFLRDPDPSTRSNALLTKANVATGLGGWGFTEGKYWAPIQSPRYFHTATRTQWLTTASWFVTIIGLAVCALGLTLATQTFDPRTLSPFGAASAHATFLVSAATPLPALSVAAAIPQVLLAGLYFGVNGLLTAFALTHESARYTIASTGAVRRSLRVSAEPVGYQTTSLYLTLPRPVSWALAGWFAAMGFVLSQACFVVVVTSASEPGVQLRGVGLGGTALVVLLGMLMVLGAVVAGLSCTKVRSAAMADGRAVGNPLAFEGGSCSAVVSARCHRVPEETEVWRGKVAWGVVESGEGGNVARHVTYSTRPLGELDGGHRYV